MFFFLFVCFFVFSYIFHIFVQWYKALLNLNLNWHAKFGAVLAMPCSILVKNLGDVLVCGLSYQGLKTFEAWPQSAFRPGLKGFVINKLT